MSRLIRMKRSYATQSQPSAIRTLSFPAIGRTTTRPTRMPSKHFYNLMVLARRASAKFYGTTALASMGSNDLSPGSEKISISRKARKGRQRRNSKHETCPETCRRIRNSKQMQMIKMQKISNGQFRILNFGFPDLSLFRISFGFWILLSSDREHPD